ncbi:MAG: hypothetical protein MUP85_00350, partial [Candidatus Lokiarchaeota archaeon]|nr:hypothetical protein [Candidatus Lokiarchaeota archaeon]
MVSLNDLTVPLLEKLAKECNIPLQKGCKKKEKIELIKAANIGDLELQELIQKYLNIKKPEKKTLDDLISELKGRIRLLEEQVKFLMSKISVSEVKLSDKENQEIITITSDLRDIKRFIKSLIIPGESISIDELIEIRELQKIPLITLKHAIYDLIDENILNASEGNSKQKLGGKIKILTRIK